MKKISNYFEDQFSQLKSVKNLTVCGMLLALSIAVSFINFYIGDSVKISFSFIFLALMGMKFGPALCGATAAMSDIIQFIIKPVGPYQPLLTLTALLSGVLYGILFYKDKNTLPRIISLSVIKGLFINQLLNTIILATMYTKGFKFFFFLRLPENLVMIPIEIIVLWIILSKAKKLIQ